jgi:hypothetical protein
MNSDFGDGAGGPGEECLSIGKLALERLGEASSGALALVRERPALVACVAAGVVGFVVSYKLLKRRRSRFESVAETVVEEAAEAGKRAKKSAVRAGKAAGRATDYAEVVRLGMKLMENPVVRGVVVTALSKQLAKRFS